MTEIWIYSYISNNANIIRIMSKLRDYNRESITINNVNYSNSRYLVIKIGTNTNKLITITGWEINPEIVSKFHEVRARIEITPKKMYELLVGIYGILISIERQFIPIYKPN